MINFIMKYYGIHIGRNIGVYTSWLKVKPLVEGYPGAEYKCFVLPSEAEYYSIHGTLKPTKITIDKAPEMPIVKQAHAQAQAQAHAQARDKSNDNSVLKALINQYYNYFVIPDGTLYVYTDGSTTNNGKANAKGGYGVFFSDARINYISKKLSGKVTNNIAELSALINAFEVLQNIGDYSKIVVFTDSEYSYLALTERYEKWEANGWVSVWKGQKQQIKNQDLIKKAYALYSKLSIELKHVKAHTGKQDIHSIGNEIADMLAEN